MRYDYRLMWDAYTGLGGFQDGTYLVKYPRETDEKYNRRKQLAFYPNFPKKIVETFTSHIFRKPPQRQIESQAYLIFIQNTDRNGTYIDDFMKKVCKLSLVFGTVFVIVDKPQGNAITVAQEKELGILPYATIRLPTQVEEVQVDEFGKIVSITFREELFLRTFTQNTWEVKVIGKQETYSGEHALGTIPVVAVSWTDSLLPTQIFCPPMIHEIAYASKDLYNAISELREILRSTTFPILTLPTKQPVGDITVGTENFIAYDPEGGGKPDFIAPPPDPAKIYMEYIQLLIEQIYKLANLEFVMGTSQQKSGVALEFEFQDLNSMLSGIAMNMEQAEYRIAELVARWSGEERFRGSISYEKDFSFRDIEREMRIVFDALSMQISQTFENELKKRIARALLPDTDDETMKRIDYEIDGLEGLDNQLKREP
ncbi:MAG: phage portal protein [Candidatus Bathyarchaeia archaeon]